MNSSNDPEISHLNTKRAISKFSKFFSGFFIAICMIYIVIIAIFGTIYGIDIIGMVVLMSIYAHIVLFPFLIYSIVGVIFVMMPDHQYISINKLIWKMIGLGILACVVSIGISEVAHTLGLWESRINFNWK